jgi:hypothetical protein
MADMIKVEVVVPPPQQSLVNIQMTMRDARILHGWVEAQHPKGDSLLNRLGDALRGQGVSR